jgi:hypothetical protein
MSRSGVACTDTPEGYGGADALPCLAARGDEPGQNRARHRRRTDGIKPASEDAMNIRKTRGISRSLAYVTLLLLPLLVAACSKGGSGY